MLALGIDPGTATTGFALVSQKGNALTAIDYGIISTSPTDPFPVRLNIIYHRLMELMTQYRPDSTAVEQLFFNRNVTTAIHVGEARGIVLLCSAQHEIPVYEYTPPQVKLAVTGYGKADKKQVQQMVKTLLHLEKIPKPDDAADALAIAICYLHSAQWGVAKPSPKKSI